MTASVGLSSGKKMELSISPASPTASDSCRLGPGESAEAEMIIAKHGMAGNTKYVLKGLPVFKRDQLNPDFIWVMDASSEDDEKIRRVYKIGNTANKTAWAWVRAECVWEPERRVGPPGVGKPAIPPPDIHGQALGTAFIVPKAEDYWNKADNNVIVV